MINDLKDCPVSHTLKIHPGMLSMKRARLVEENMSYEDIASKTNIFSDEEIPIELFKESC
jgi:hypothetical protein